MVAVGIFFVVFAAFFVVVVDLENSLDIIYNFLSQWNSSTEQWGPPGKLLAREFAKLRSPTLTIVVKVNIVLFLIIVSVDFFIIFFKNFVDLTTSCDLSSGVFSCILVS